MRFFTILCAALVLASLAFAQQPAPKAAAAPAPRLDRVDFRRLPLTEACRLLSDLSGLNLAPSEEAGKREVSLYLRDVDPMSAVEALCRAHGMWFRRDELTRIVRIGTPDEWRRDLTSLQAETTEFFTLMYPNANDVGFAIRNLFGNRVVLGTNEADQELLRDLRERFTRFDLIDSRTQGLGGGLGGGLGSNAASNISSYLGGQGLDGGVLPYTNPVPYGGYGGGQQGTEGDYTRTRAGDLSPEQIQRVEDALSGKAEAGAARAALARQDRAPIHVTVARRQNMIAVRTSDPEAMEEIKEIVQKLDVPTALVLLEVRILQVDLLDGMNSFFEYQGGFDNFGLDFATGDILNAPGRGVAGTGTRLGDLIFQYVDSNFAARMQVLERENRVRSLATPILLTANNEVSRLFVGREVPLNRSFTGGQVVSNTNTTTTATGSTAIEFRPVGTTLLITPNINADRTVTLRIVQETSDVNSTATVLVPTVVGFAPQSLPVVSSQSVSGTIVAKSDLAVAFGGLIEDGVRKEKSQVPILGDIPLIGILFQRKDDADTRREIVVVVRPYVLSTPAEGEAVSARLFESLGVEPMKSAAEIKAGKKTGEKQSADVAPGSIRVHGLDDEDGPR